MNKWKINNCFLDIASRYIILFTVLSIIIPTLPLQVLADTVVTAPKDTVVVSQDEDNDTYVDVDVDVVLNSNHRMIGYLDAAKISNTLTHYNSDYNITYDKDTILDTFGEYKLADILETEYWDTKVQKQISVVENKNNYSSQLEYLIDNNIINRFGNYIYNRLGTHIGTDRVIHKDLRDEENIILNTSSTGLSSQIRYSNPDTKISKTDFLTELMKISNVHQSRVIGVQIPYRRTNINLGQHTVDYESAEVSPYQQELGEAGVDTNLSDIIINHGVFRQLELMSTNDVTEAYLYDALQKGIITENDLGGIEGNAFKVNQPKDNITLPGSWYETSPIRQMYISSLQLSTKDMNLLSNYVDEKYMEELEKYIDGITTEINSTETNDGLAYPWGNSFYYSINECTFGNPYSVTATEIIKRPSIVDVNQGFKDPLRADEKGYQYFNNEEITLADAYVLVYKYLKTSDTDSKITQQESDYITSIYGLDFANLLEEECNAVKYLIAKGIIDPENSDILNCATTQLDNYYAIDLIYHVLNKEARFKLNPVLTENQQDMLQRGYAQNTYTVSETSKSMPLTYNYIRDNGEGQTLNDAVIEDRIKNTTNYYTMYVRLPKKYIQGSSVNDKNANTYELVTDDKYRIHIDPYNMYFNGGQSETYVDTDGNLVSAGDNYLGNINTSQGENIYTTNAVYIDLDDYAWVRYMIHKDTNNMLLNVRMADGTIKTYKGILGAGIYYLKDDNDTIFSKIDTTVAKSSSFGRIQDLYKKVIVNDMEKTALLQQNYSASQLSMLDTHSLPSKYMTNLSSIYLYAINDTNNYIEDYNLYNFNDNIIYCDSSLYDIGHNYNIETKSTDVLNYRYLYGASTTGFIKIGPISYSNMTGLLVAGEQLFAEDNPGSGTFHVTEDVQFLDFDIDVDRIEIEVVNGNTINDNIYYLKYNTTTQAIPIEAARFFDLLEYEINSGGVKVPGYASIATGDGSEDRINLISIDEIANLGLGIINVEKEGEYTGDSSVYHKLLYNRFTGQYAFINTDESFTLIGNNITKYDDSQVLVNKLGDSGVFYNIDIILELANDVEHVMNNTGRVTGITVSEKQFQYMPAYIIDSDDYDLINASLPTGSTALIDSSNKETNTRDFNLYKDITYATVNGEELKHILRPLDRTYIAVNKDYKEHINQTTGNGFAMTNLSALASKASNFFYVKDKVGGFNALVIYYPKEKPVIEGSISNNKSSAINTTKVTTTTSKSNDINSLMASQLSQYLFTNQSLSKNVTIFDNEADKEITLGALSDNILPEDYNYNIYLLSSDITDTGRDQTKDSFVTYLSNYLGSSLSDSITNNIEISYSTSDFMAISNPGDIKYYEDTSGNLYWINYSKGNINYIDSANEYIKRFHNRLYYQPGDRADVSGDPIYKSNSTSGTGFLQEYLDYYGKNVNKIPIMFFRSSKLYNNTPNDSTPLEYYAVPAGSSGQINDKSGQGTQDIMLGETAKKFYYTGTSNEGKKQYASDLYVTVFSNKNSTNTIQPFASLTSDGIWYAQNLRGSNNIVSIVPPSSSTKSTSDGKNIKTSYDYGYDTTDGFTGYYTSLRLPVTTIDKVFDNNLMHSIYGKNDNMREGYGWKAYASQKHSIVNIYNTMNTAYFQSAVNSAYDKFKKARSDTGSVENKFSAFKTGATAKSPVSNTGASTYALSQIYNTTWDNIIFAQTPNGNSFINTYSLNQLFSGKALDIYGTEYGLSVEKNNKKCKLLMTMVLGCPPAELTSTNNVFKKIADKFIFKIDNYDWAMSDRASKTGGTYTKDSIDGLTYGCYILWEIDENGSMNNISLRNTGTAKPVGIIPISKSSYFYTISDNGDLKSTTNAIDNNLLIDKNSTGVNTINSQAYYDINYYSHMNGASYISEALSHHLENNTFIYDTKNKNIEYAIGNESDTGNEGTWAVDIAAKSYMDGVYQVLSQTGLCRYIANTYVINNTKVDFHSKDSKEKGKGWYTDNNLDSLKNIPIYINPVLPVPYSSTYVNKYGMLVSAPSDTARTNINYVSNINNSLLARLRFDIQGDKGLTYLMDIEEGSQVRLNEIYSFIKTSSGIDRSNITTKQAIEKSGWVTALLPPQSSILTNHQCDYSEVNDYRIGYNLLYSIASVNISDLFGAEGCGIKFLQAMSINMWNTPTVDTIITFKDKINNIIGNKLDKNLWLLKNRKSDIIYSKDNTATGITVTDVTAYNISSNGDPTELNINNKAFIIPECLLSPTLVVEKDVDGVYDIKGWVNPALYGVDIDDSYVEYLKTRNTDAKDLNSALDVVRGQSIDGNYYRSYMQSLLAENWFTYMLEIIQYGLFGIIIVLWILATYIFIFLWSPVGVSLFDAIGSSLGGIDLPAKLTFGLFSVYEEPSISKYFLYSFLCFILCALLLSNTLLYAILMLWQFIITKCI